MSRKEERAPDCFSTNTAEELSCFTYKPPFQLKQREKRNMSMITRREFLRVSAAAAAGIALTACQPATEAPVEEKKAEETPMEEKAAGPERGKVWPLTDVPRNRTLIYYNNTPPAGNFAYYGGANHKK